MTFYTEQIKSILSEICDKIEIFEVFVNISQITPSSGEVKT